MPKNKQAYTRYKIFDELLNEVFQKNVGISKIEIQRKIELAIGKSISASQIDKDIRALRVEEAAPIVCENNLYYYSKPFKLGFNLSEEEISFLELISESTIKIFKDTELNNVNNSIIKKLLLFSHAKANPKVIFEIPETIAGIKNFVPLFNVIDLKKNKKK